MISSHKEIIERNPGALVMAAMKCSSIKDLGESQELRLLCIVIRDVTGMSNDAKSYFTLTEELLTLELNDVDLAAANARWIEIQTILRENCHGIRIKYGMAWMRDKFPKLHEFLSSFIANDSSARHLPRNASYPAEPIICEQDKQWFFKIVKDNPWLSYGGNVVYY